MTPFSLFGRRSLLPDVKPHDSRLKAGVRVDCGFFVQKVEIGQNADKRNGAWSCFGNTVRARHCYRDTKEGLIAQGNAKSLVTIVIPLGGLKNRNKVIAINSRLIIACLAENLH